jgi:glycosyltransferase involved in cell wall biosynthesis
MSDIEPSVTPSAPRLPADQRSDACARAAQWMSRTVPLGHDGARRDELGIAGVSLWLMLWDHLGPFHDAIGFDQEALVDWLLAQQDPERRLFAGMSKHSESQMLPIGTGASRAATAIALLAMKPRGRRPIHALPLLDELERVGGTTAWLASLDWTDAMAADDVMSMGLCLIHQAEAEGRREARAQFHRLLDGLEGMRDSPSGLFAAASGQDVWRSVIATDCVVALHTYVRRPLQTVSRLIDSTLSLADSDDGLARTRGSAREALAAVRILTLLRWQSRYRRDDIQEMLSRTYEAIAASQHDDGGMPETHSSAASSRLFDVSIAAGPSAVTSALYALWLRLVTMSAIECAGVTVATRQATEWPGLGYHATSTALTAHERVVLPHWLRRTACPALPSRAPEEPPAVSVIVPCYNLGHYLHEAIESVLAQTSHDFEIVVIDDGSTDEYTRLVLSQFERPRTAIVHQANRGLAHARNAGIARSTGRYICCLDPDDRLRPGFFERACAILDTDSEVGFVSAHFEMFDERDGAFRFESCDFPLLLVHNRAIEPALFRRAAWERAGGYFAGFSSSGIEDWDLWITVVELGYRAAIIPETMWDYRVRSDQMTTAMYQPERWRQLNSELVRRHPDTYRAHLNDVIASHAERWADLRGWIETREAAVSWWQHQAGNWQRSAIQCGDQVQRLQRQLADLAAASTSPADSSSESS